VSAKGTTPGGKIIFFTAKGNVYLEGSSCQTLNDQYIYLD